MTGTRVLATAALAAAAAAVAWTLAAQQRGGADEINQRAVTDRAYQTAWATQPGGTPEDQLWQVLVLMGVGDAQSADWSGRLSLAGGDVHSVEGYRFELPDRVLPEGGWRLHTKIERVLASSPIEGGGVPERLLLPKGVMVRGSGGAAARVSLQTAQGACEFTPGGIPFGSPQPCLGGRIEVHRTPPATDLSGTTLRQHDFPSLAAGSGGALWAAWLSYHDRREELNFRRFQNGRWTRLIPVGRASEDLWRPQVATDAGGKPWLVWSQQEGGNWDIWAMAWEANEWGPRVRLSEGALPDIEPHVARGPDGTIWVVWQAMAQGHSQVRLRYLRAGRWSEIVPVTDAPYNDWSPAVAAGGDGRAWIAWDRYRTSYDVFCRSFTPGAGLGPEMPLAASARFEGYPSVAVDERHRPWVAWETGGENWGKDLGAALGKRSPGTPLGGPRAVEVACLDGGRWRSPAPVAFRDSLAVGSRSDSDPVLVAAPGGAVWMAFKRRFARMAYRPSVYFETYLTRLEGGGWSRPVPLPGSWNRKSAFLGLAVAGERLWAFWPSESRAYDFASRPLAGRVMAGSIVLPPPGAAPVFHDRPAAPSAPGPGEDLAAIRNYRVKSGAETWRIVRGDLHRHTELSQDVGGLDDGTLPEFYRYMIDAAGMDFGASTDHQGGGTDYWNFMTQKMADMYHVPGRFVTFYAYERNLGNPFGHRNVLHTTRDYPIVPFFQRIDARFMLPDSPDGELLTFNSMSFGSGIRNDTKLFWDSVRKTGGLTIPHTSATDSMGTDWSDGNDPQLEPVVEIYQGARQNYEHKNAPRGIQDGAEKKALGGFQEAGLVWNAWKKGYRLGVISSSDHYSTHISYAMVYTPAVERQAIFDSIGKRRTYGATDNIILEFWLGEHFMGDDFTAAQPQKIRVKLRGTDAIEAVHLIRDATYIYKVAPGSRDVEFEYFDQDVKPGAHWYYVRAEQRNGELAWSSPIWVSYR